MHKWSPRRPPGDFTVPVPADPSGKAGPTPGQARGARWRSTSAGLFVPADVDATRPEQRIAEAAALLPAHGAVTGWAALRMLGGAFFDGRNQPVPLVAPRASRRRRAGVAFFDDRLDPSQITTVRGIRVTTPRRAVFDAIRRCSDVREAVVAMDMAAAAWIMSVGRMRTYVAGFARWTGLPLTRQALVLASDDSRSPMESYARLIWLLDARLPQPLVNQPVFSRDGRLLGYPDLFDPETGLAVEYDGEDHRDPRRHSSDVDREDLFRSHRIEVTRLTGADVRSPARAADRMLRARARAASLRPADREWTLEPPEWFRPGPPLDLELDLRGESA